MGRIINMTQIQSLGVDSQKQMRNGPVPRQRSQIIPPLRQPLWLVLRLRHQLHRIKRRRVRNHRLLRLDDIPVLQTHSHSPAIFNQNLVHVRIQLELPSELLKTTLQRVSQLTRSPDGNREGSRFLEESLEDVQQVGRHGSLGRKAAEDAHGVNKVSKEGDRNELVNSLREIVEREGEVGEDIGVSEYERQRSRGSGEEASVLT
mmetsp:Transcript_25654/g.41695  ORF Transcript_25654/g.41695 Transcript_25654/m.41695 type:complete len:204 (+) Transcript_25654:821-1432(+)